MKTALTSGNIPQPHIKNFYKVLSIENVPLTEPCPPLSVSSYEPSQNPTDLYVELTLATYSSSKEEPKSNIKPTPNNPLIYLLLSGWWNQTLLNINDIIFLSAFYNPNKKCYELSTKNITDKDREDPIAYILNNIIIVEPDRVLSPSSIKSGQRCLRAAFFQDQFILLTSPVVSRPILIGDVIHLLLEYLLSHLNELITKPSLTGIQMEEFLLPELEKILNSKIIEIRSINETYSEIYNLTKNFIPLFHHLLMRYIKNQYPIEGGLKIVNFVSSETLYQSPLIGLKGIIDCVMEVQNVKTYQTFKAPFEIKTGAQNIAIDQIQVIIYCMLLSIELNQNSKNGILAYFSGHAQTVKLLQVRYNINELIPIFLLRNFIIHYSQALEKKYDNIETLVNNCVPSLPIGGGFNNIICNKCFRKQVCQSHFFLCETSKYNNRNSNRNSRNSNCSNIEDLPSWAKDGYEEYTSVDSRIKNYFKEMSIIINNYNSGNWQKELLSKMKSQASQKHIDAYYKFIIYDYKECEHSFNIKMKLDNKHNKMDIATNDELRRASYMLVYFYDLNTHTIATILDKACDPSHLSITLLKHLTSENISNYLRSNRVVYNETPLYIKLLTVPYKFHDKLTRGNVLLLCGNPTKSDIIYNLQQILIFHKQPTFNLEKQYMTEILKYIHTHFKNDFLSLNLDQKRALTYSLLCNDFTLIKGFPGSGKSTLISLLIRILHARGNMILISSFTNSALDNILIKLKEYDIDFLRATKQKEVVNPQIHDHIFNSSKFNSIEECDKYLNNIRIIASTALGMAHPLLENKIFDYCIIDEACQIFEPVLLGPLLCSKKFILVGDPNQLTPTLRYDLQNINKAYSDSFYDTKRNIFSILESKNPNGCINLEVQYRMNEDVLKISNECVYNNQMKCASDELKKSRLDLNVKTILNEEMKYILDPNKSVILIDYSLLYDNTTLNEVNVRNEFEGEICLNIYNALVQADFDLKRVGIITPYKEQELYLKKKVNYQIDVMTIDKSQGIEKDLIIISFVKTNLTGTLLTDIARINVAFTRAKTKLVVIGIIDALKAISNVGKFFQLLERNNWVYYMKKDNSK